MSGCAEAKAFALLSEEGIAKGIRRVVAVTAGEAQEAITAGELLTERIVTAGRLPPLQLEKELGALKAVRQDHSAGNRTVGITLRMFTNKNICCSPNASRSLASCHRCRGEKELAALKAVGQEPHSKFTDNNTTSIFANKFIARWWATQSSRRWSRQASVWRPAMETSALTKGRWRRRVTNPSLRFSVLDIAVSLLQAVDNTVIPAVVKAGLRAEISALTRASLEAQKKAASGNKNKAAGEAVAAAEAAQASGAKFIALQVDVSCFQSDGFRKRTETRFKITVGPSAPPPSACQAAQASVVNSTPSNWTCAAHSRGPVAKWRLRVLNTLALAPTGPFSPEGPATNAVLDITLFSISNSLPLSPFESSDSVVV